MMADQRTMAELLHAPTEGYAEAIVVPLILTEQYELKHNLINMMTSDQFFRLEKDNPHDHIRWFNKITSTIKYKDVPNSAIKFMLFPFSLARAARRTTNLRNKISNFRQRLDESFHEAWDRYKDLLRACPHHGFTELHQLDTFYNALNPIDQDSLNSAAGGNLLERRTQDVLTIIENKSKCMRTRSSSNLPGESPHNPTSSNPKCRKRRRSKQPFILKESLVDTMADQRTMAELLHAPTEGYAEAIVGQSVDGSKKNPCVLFSLGRILFPNSSMYSFSPQERQITVMKFLIFNNGLMNHFMKHMIDTKISFVDANSSSSSEIAKLTHVVNQQTSAMTTAMIAILKQFQATLPPGFVKAIKEICVICGDAHPYYHFDVLTIIKIIQAKLTHAVNQQTSVVTTAMIAILKQFQATSPPTFIKAIKEIYVTCGGAHPYYQYLVADGNTFSKLWDNIQGYDSAAIVTYNQVVPLSELEKIKRMNEANMKALQTQINNVKNKLRNEMKISIQAFMSNQTNELKNMMASFFQMNTASTSGLGPLPSNTIANPKGELKAITTQSGIVLDGPSKKLGLPELISTCMTLKLANRAICTPAGVARDVFGSVGKFTFPVDFVIVDYESDLGVPLILGRPFLRTARALIDVHRKEMILHDDDIFDPKGGNVLIEKCIDLDSTKDLRPPHNVNPLSGSTTSSSSPNHLLEEFADELALITFPPGSGDLPFNIESDLKEIEYLLNRDPIKDMDSILEDSIDENNLANLNDNLVDTIPEMFTDEHALDYPSPSLYDEYDDDRFEVESDTEYVYDDPFESKGEKMKESKLFIDELDLPRSSDFLPSPEYDLFLFEDFSKVDALPLTNNEDKVFNLGILIQRNPFEVITHVAPDKIEKKLAISHAFLILKNFDPPLSLFELPFLKEVPGSKTLLSFSSKNKEKVFKPKILTSKGVHISLLLELSHRGPKAFKVIKIPESPMEIFPCSFGEDIRILDVPCLHFYPL
nr:reverse transcriptase domain-containing protein [Tanacetum cinerariifolium]